MRSKLSFRLCCIILLLSGGKGYAQQNIQFTQYIFNSLSVNPAYAGYKEQWYGQLGLRSQWVGLDGAPQTALLSIDGVTNQVDKRHGVGLQLTADKLGPQSATSAYLNYAFRIRLDDLDTKRLSFGLGAGMTQYSLDGTMLDPVTTGDPNIPLNRISDFVPDIRFGIHYSTPSWYAGVSIMDLLSGDQSNNIFRWGSTTTDNLRRRPHVYVMAGALWNLEGGLRFRPSLLWKEDFRGPSSLDLNAMFILGDRFWAGAGWRTGVTAWTKDYQTYTGNSLSKRNSFSGIVQFYATERFRVGYSYDYIVSRLSSVQNGTHEITLGVTFGQEASRVLSPRFF